MWQVKVKSRGRVYLSRHIYSAKYGTFDLQVSVVFGQIDLIDPSVGGVKSQGTPVIWHGSEQISVFAVLTHLHALLSLTSLSAVQIACTCIHFYVWSLQWTCRCSVEYEMNMDMRCGLIWWLVKHVICKVSNGYLLPIMAGWDYFYLSCTYWNSKN